MSQPATEMKHGGRFHVDDRGTRYCSIFPEIGKGDINVTVVEPGAAALWHRHEHQSDYQFVVKGALKIGMCNMSDDPLTTEVDEWQKTRTYCELDDWPEFDPVVQWHYLSERNANEGPLYIPPGIWHGCINYTNEQAILIYHITNKWDGNDEDRCDPETMGWPVEREAK
jgi:dTDP-4-dehydrorhamnose 3,5-epimerase-like enzyme|tara:strand:+ start:5924 stop:6430 length:507 start_codon:yes stop_codon:yes gene_type:complete